MPVGLTLYKILMFLIAPFAGAIFRRRARAGKENAARISERFTYAPSPRPAGRLIWLHAASVGESQILLELGRRLILEGLTDTTLLFTCQTETAANLLARAIATLERPKSVTLLHRMAPVDTPRAAKRFLAHWAPDAAIFAEGEVWPNLLRNLRASGTKTALINARMTERSITGWLRWPRTAKSVFSSFDLLSAADLQTKTGLEALSGQNVLHPGNLKSALPIPGASPDEVKTIEAQIGPRPILVAASTHPGEEALALDALMQMDPKPFLIIAPRHPERADDIMALLTCSDFEIAQRSEDQTVTEQTDILLADTMGEMGLWYRIADAVYLGGGHAPGVGGHNPIEALRLSKPILSGPSVFNFRDLSERIKSYDGYEIIEDAEMLAKSFPPAPVSQALLDLLEADAVGPMTQTLDALKAAGLLQ
ncbi:MAG: glycosyltransferase N-terminal domain-containing protein [Pseudomonadota bacterium]